MSDPFNKRKCLESKTGQSRSGDGQTLPLHVIESLIASLTNDVEGTLNVPAYLPSAYLLLILTTEGIVTYFRDESKEGELCLRYQHLNPSTHFDEILSSARCVILAGGTMSPVRRACPSPLRYLIIAPSSRTSICSYFRACRWSAFRRFLADM